MPGSIVRRWRNFRRQLRWPAPERVIGDFYQAIHNVGDMHRFYSLVELSPDISGGIPGSIAGKCYVCNRDVDFKVDIPFVEKHGIWRETLACPHCSLINRWRGSVHMFEALAAPMPEDRIYVTEQLGLLFQTLCMRHPGCVGSEFFSDEIRGSEVQTHAGPVRNQDVTQLTFADKSFEAVLTFDVLEHVPEYKKALSEFCRILAPGGQLLISVPFNFMKDTTIRARINDQGSINHLMEPVYHGDPLSADGVLCFYDFGLGLLQELKNAGFQESFAVCFSSLEWGYFEKQIMFVGRKRR